jgi:hypothetical protein
VRANVASFQAPPLDQPVRARRRAASHSKS